MADGFSVKGADQVIQNLSAFSKRVIEEVVSGCEAVQQNVINAAKVRVPVVTGNLQGSILPGGIIITDENVQAFIAANAEYASYVEGVPDALGRMGRGRKTPFLGPSVYENQGTFIKAMEAAIKRAGA